MVNERIPIEIPGLYVTVDRVMYHPRQDLPPDRPYCFVYFITIHNESDQTVTFKGRKWVVRNQRGDVTALEGEGIVGQQPTLSPGGTFNYNSFHLLETARGEAEGAYLGLNEKGQRVLARIPRFTLEADGEDAD